MPSPWQISTTFPDTGDLLNHSHFSPKRLHSSLLCCTSPCTKKTTGPRFEFMYKLASGSCISVSTSPTFSTFVQFASGLRMRFSVAAVLLAALSVFPSSQAVPSSLVSSQIYRGEGELTNKTMTLPSSPPCITQSSPGRYYALPPGFGPCDNTNTGSDYVAVSRFIFSDALCGKNITATSKPPVLNFACSEVQIIEPSRHWNSDQCHCDGSWQVCQNIVFKCFSGFLT